MQKSTAPLQGFRSAIARPAVNLQHLVATYSHFGEIFPSRPVRRAATPWLFKRATEPSISYTFRSDRFSIQDYLGRNPTTGLLIAKDDTILYEHYQYARTDRDRFLSQSMAKTITAMLIGIAVSEGKIKSIDDPVSAYVPGLATAEYGKTSIRNLLHMSSGVDFTEIYDGKDDIAKLSRDLFAGSGKDPVASVAQFNTRIAPPGTRWHYASVETEILGLVLRCRHRRTRRGLSSRQDLATDRRGGRRVVGHRRHRAGNHLLLLQRGPARLRAVRPSARP